MIEKLRRKFILVAMCSTFAVLAVIVGAMNLISYHTMIVKTDAVLEMLASNNGRFPDRLFETEEADFKKEPGMEPWMIFPQDKEETDRLSTKGPYIKDKGRNFNREMPYETRFFFVKMTEEGQVSMVDTGKISAVSSQEAALYAQLVLKKYQSSGKTGGFRNDYRYLITKQSGEYLVVFVDAVKETENARNILVISLLVSFFGLLAVFLLVVIFSRLVFRPVEAGYQKQKQFITDASHELKTPLTIISANVEVLEMESGESQWSASIQKQIQRMIGLVEQMVALSRMDEEKEIKQEEFSLSDAVRETAELFLPVAAGVGKSLEISVQEEISCNGEEAKIRQMVGLLLDNAVKYAAAVGEPLEPDAQTARIRISLHKKGKKAELVLWNTAAGMSKGNQDILFERFYRPDSSRNSNTGGSGIGLSIVKSIVESHKGRITAVSEDGKSIEFRAVLPIH